MAAYHLDLRIAGFFTGIVHAGLLARLTESSAIVALLVPTVLFYDVKSLL